MKVSICIRKHKTADGREFYGATARGKFLEGVKGISQPEADENFVVKLTAGSGSLPADEGVYTLECDGDAWLDRREGVSCGSLRVVRVKGVCSFEKKADFKPF